MSYRYRFAQASKKYVEQVMYMNIQELIEFTKAHNAVAYEYLDEEDAWLTVWNVVKQSEIFDFGDCPFVDAIWGSSTPLFQQAETNEYFNENHLRLCTQNTFLIAIDALRELIKKNYEELRDSKDKEYLFFENKAKAWSKVSEFLDISQLPEEKQDSINHLHFPYNIALDDAQIVSSWEYEYAIFELVRLYKSFDWENNYLIFLGW